MVNLQTNDVMNNWEFVSRQRKNAKGKYKA